VRTKAEITSPGPQFAQGEFKSVTGLAKRLWLRKIAISALIYMLLFSATRIITDTVAKSKREIAWKWINWNGSVCIAWIFGWMVLLSMKIIGLIRFESESRLQQTESEIFTCWKALNISDWVSFSKIREIQSNKSDLDRNRIRRNVI
jgi:hypothetical protein